MTNQVHIIWWAATYISFYQCNQWKPSKYWWKAIFTVHSITKTFCEISIALILMYIWRILQKLQHVFLDTYCNLTIFHKDSYSCIYRTFTIDFRTSFIKSRPNICPPKTQTPDPKVILPSAKISDCTNRLVSLLCKKLLLCRPNCHHLI